MKNKYSIGAAIVGAILLIAIQFVPYGHDHTNPPVVQEPKWDSPKTRELAVRACFNCHSNQTEWPWYSNVAPMSWLVQNDVEQGRDQMNLSEWDQPQRNARKAPQFIESGEMPRWYYVLLHPEARLSPEQRQALAQGWRATLSNR
jgi:mono/diheme cytochrome c family protein